jgi:hypothetical protein
MKRTHGRLLAWLQRRRASVLGLGGFGFVAVGAGFAVEWWLGVIVAGAAMVLASEGMGE